MHKKTKYDNNETLKIYVQIILQTNLAYLLGLCQTVYFFIRENFYRIAKGELFLTDRERTLMSFVLNAQNMDFDNLSLQIRKKYLFMNMITTLLTILFSYYNTL